MISMSAFGEVVPESVSAPVLAGDGSGAIVGAVGAVVSIVKLTTVAGHSLLAMSVTLSSRV